MVASTTKITATATRNVYRAFMQDSVVVFWGRLACLCSEVASNLEHEIGRLGEAAEIRARRPEIGRDETAQGPVI